MKLFIIIVIHLFIFDAYAIRVKVYKKPWNCPGLQEKNQKYLKEKWEKYEGQSSRRDVEGKINSYSRYFKEFCENESYISDLNVLSDRIIKKGWQSETELLEDEIDRISKYRVPKKEWDRLAEFASKVRKTRDDILSKSEFDKIVSSNQQTRLIRQKSCQEKDNRKQPLKGKIRDQDGLGWCYAYTAADLISHHTGKLASAVDIANSFNNASEWGSWFGDKVFKTPESEQEGGWVKSAIESSVERGICLEKDIRSSDFTFQNYKNLDDAIKELEKLKSDFDTATFVKPKTGRANRKILEERKRRLKAQRKEKVRAFVGDCSVLHGNWRQIFSSITNDEVIEVLRQSGPVDVVNRMIDKNCKNRRRLYENIEVETNYTGLLTSSDDLISEMDEQLNKGNIVGISYKLSLLLDAYDDRTGNHASSIVARKYDPESGSCKYLIRNSWGDGCYSYDNRYDCKNGEVWVPHEDLTRMVYGITYIKK